MLSSIKQQWHSITETAPSGPAASKPVAQPLPAAEVVDSRAQKLLVAGWELEGVSIAGQVRPDSTLSAQFEKGGFAQETCIIVPRAKVAFDIGRCPQRAVFQQTVLISHGHLDHIGGCPFHVASRSMQALPPSKLVVPPAYVETLKSYLDLSQQLQGSPPGVEYEVLPLQTGEELSLPSGFLCRPFPTTHTIASQGYLIYSLRKKLRSDLQGRSQEDIRSLRLAGEEVQETHQVPEIAFTGDTTSAFLDQAGIEDVLHARLLIMEMSFLDDAVSVEEAKEKGHMHIADFIAHAHRFQNEAILLIHFSARYKRSHILSALNILPPNLRSRCVSSVSLSAFAYLFSELIQYAMERATSTGELEDRLDRVGYDVGVRMLELLSWRERALKRKPEVLDVMRFIHNVAWPALFGKPADDLQQGATADDEYMISDNEPMLHRYISVPRSYDSFNPGALVAGVVRGMLDTAGFPARVSAHSKEGGRGDKAVGRGATIILIKLDPAVMTRQANMEALRRA
ncbi:hypothetical protein QJQ45_021986 [Haematococcus lacustris]|nr:hypothetical protein QJQ45_021986 [Haematococcus lacustris]